MRLLKRVRDVIAIGLLPLAVVAVQSTTADGRDKELLDALLKNGAITKEQYQQLLDPGDAVAPGAAEDAAPVPVPVPVSGTDEPADTEEAQAETVEHPNNVNMRLGNRGLVVSTDDERFSMTLSGRLHAEASVHANDEDLPHDDRPTDGAEVRRARLMLAAKFYEDWNWVGEVDFADNDVAIKDFWLSYSGLPYTTLYVGHQKQPFSLDIEMSSNDIAFVERSVDNFLLAPFVDRAIGLRAEFTAGRWFLATGIYGEGVEPNKENDEGWGTAGRLIYDPLLTDEMVLHLGIRGAYREPQSGAAVRIKDETTHMSNLTVVDTGAIDDVQGVTLVGPEVAFATGPFEVVTEYNEAFFHRHGSPDVQLKSWHVNGAWIMTGETRVDSYRLNAGEFKRLEPENNFSLSGGGWGAWEFATRIAGIDLNDHDIRGGDELVFTAGINWYLNPVVRIMADWSRILDTDEANDVSKAAEGIDFFQFRTQVAF